MMDYDIRAERVEEAVRADARASSRRRCRRCTARAGSPSARWCRATETNRIMDELWELGARGILVTDIHACRL